MAANETQVNVKSYAAGNVTTSAYVELIASLPISTSKLQILDTSGQILKIATGQSGSEVDICSTSVSGAVVVDYYLPIGTRLSIKAVNASATTGYNVISLIP